jgi:hypothetical protein
MSIDYDRARAATERLEGRLAAALDGEVDRRTVLGALGAAGAGAAGSSGVASPADDPRSASRTTPRR